MEGEDNRKDTCSIYLVFMLLVRQLTHDMCGACCSEQKIRGNALCT